jgi:hypothetical protein
MVLYILAMNQPPIAIATAHRRYTVQLALLMICYAVVLCISLKLIPIVSHGWLRVLFALMPILPIVFVLGAVIRLLSRVDELCRRVHLEAAALAAGVTALLGITCGFLQNVGMPPLSGFWTFGAINSLYAIFALLLNRRYR